MQNTVQTLTTTPGTYVVFHHDYSCPLRIVVSQNNYRTVFWSAQADREGSEVFEKQMYLGDSEDFAYWVSIRLSIDERPRCATG
jgi:hypothetical protein